MLLEGALSNGGAPTRFAKRLFTKSSDSSPKVLLPKTLHKALHGYSPKMFLSEALPEALPGYPPKASVPFPEALHGQKRPTLPEAFRKVPHETKKSFFSFRGKLDPTFLSKLAKSGD